MERFGAADGKWRNDIDAGLSDATEGRSRAQSAARVHRISWRGGAPSQQEAVSWRSSGQHSFSLPEHSDHRSFDCITVMTTRSSEVSCCSSATPCSRTGDCWMGSRRNVRSCSRIPVRPDGYSSFGWRPPLKQRRVKLNEALFEPPAALADFRERERQLRRNQVVVTSEGEARCAAAGAGKPDILSTLVGTRASTAANVPSGAQHDELLTS
jgi:hypothetical protein